MTFQLKTREDFIICCFWNPKFIARNSSNLKRCLAESKCDYVVFLGERISFFNEVFYNKLNVFLWISKY